MSRPSITVVIPTVPGREKSLLRSMSCYERTIPADVQYLIDVRRGYSTCGAAWNDAAEVCKTDLLHLSADDLYPMPGWFDAGLDMLEQWDGTPSPRVYDDRTGMLQYCGNWNVKNPPEVGSPVHMTTIPMLWRKTWIPIPPIHYFSDNAVSCAQGAQNLVPRRCPDYAFRHGWQTPSRKAMQGHSWESEKRAFMQFTDGLERLLEDISKGAK